MFWEYLGFLFSDLPIRRIFLVHFSFFLFFLMYSLHVLGINPALVLCAVGIFLHRWFAFFVHCINVVLWAEEGFFPGIP